MGLASGVTFIVAARWIRKIFSPRRLILGATVAPKEIAELLRSEADHVEVISKPTSSNFSHVGQFYKDFNPVTDEQVIEILHKRRNLCFIN